MFRRKAKPPWWEGTDQGGGGGPAAGPNFLQIQPTLQATTTGAARRLSPAAGQRSTRLSIVDQQSLFHSMLTKRMERYATSVEDHRHAREPPPREVAGRPGDAERSARAARRGSCAAHVYQARARRSAPAAPTDAAAATEGGGGAGGAAAAPSSYALTLAAMAALAASGQQEVDDVAEDTPCPGTGAGQNACGGGVGGAAAPGGSAGGPRRSLATGVAALPPGAAWASTSGTSAAAPAQNYSSRVIDYAATKASTVAASSSSAPTPAQGISCVSAAPSSPAPSSSRSARAAAARRKEVNTVCAVPARKPTRGSSGAYSSAPCPLLLGESCLGALTNIATAQDRTTFWDGPLRRREQ